jgi:hypothetical protein
MIRYILEKWEEFIRPGAIGYMNLDNEQFTCFETSVRMKILESFENSAGKVKKFKFKMCHYTSNTSDIAPRWAIMSDRHSSVNWDIQLTDDGKEWDLATLVIVRNKKTVHFHNRDDCAELHRYWKHLKPITEELVILAKLQEY